MPWTFFANAVSNSGNSLVSNAQLVTKVYFPRLIMPAASVLAGLVDLALRLAAPRGMMLYYGIRIRRASLLLPLFVLLDVSARSAPACGCPRSTSSTATSVSRAVSSCRSGSSRRRGRAVDRRARSACAGCYT